MLNKNVWIPILILVLIAIGFGLFYGRQVAKQEPVKVYKPVDVSKPATPKPPPPGETAESGHWHGDEWHSQPHAPATPNTPPRNAETAETQNPPPHHSREPASWSSWDFQAAYQGIREKYPDQTQNPPPFENVPVDLWDFQATKIAFMDNFNFYVAKGGNKPEVFENNREVRIAEAVMANIYNAAEPTFGLFTPEQCEEIKEMRRRYFDFKGVKVNHDRVWELVHDEGYSVTEALRISDEEDSN